MSTSPASNHLEIMTSIVCDRQPISDPIECGFTTSGKVSDAETGLYEVSSLKMRSLRVYMYMYGNSTPKTAPGQFAVYNIFKRHHDQASFYPI